MSHATSDYRCYRLNGEKRCYIVFASKKVQDKDWYKSKSEPEKEAFNYYLGGGM